MKINFTNKDIQGTNKGDLKKAKTVNAGATEVFINEADKNNPVIKKYEKIGKKVTVVSQEKKAFGEK